MEERTIEHKTDARFVPGYPIPIKRMVKANEELKLAVRPRNKAAINANRHSFASFLYSPDPDPFLNYLDVQRTLSIALGQSQKYRKKASSVADFLDHYADVEIYSRLVRDTSLSDIEQMRLPLNLDQISQINRMLRLYMFPRLRRYECLSQDALWLLPTQTLARTQFVDKGKNKPIPMQLRNLSSRAVAYLDYYLPFLTTHFVDKDAVYAFYQNIRWIGRNIWPTFGHYVPARLGLSPASTIKIFEDKLDEMNLPFGVGKRILNLMEKEARDAYRKDALPVHLHKYLHYDRSKDQEAGVTLQEYYAAKYSSFEALPASVDELFNRLSLYRKSFARDIKTASCDLRLQLPQHPVIGEILLTSQYPQTLMVVLLFKKGGLHVTLEVNSSQRVYGLPRNLVAESPHVIDLLGKDIFGTILDQAKQRHPEVEPEPWIALQETSKFIAQSPVLTLPAQMLETEKQPIEPKPEKRKRRLGLIPQFMQAQPELPQPIQTRQPIFKVFHTKAEIVGLLGKNTPEEVIDRIMQDIARFECGDKKISPLQEGAGLFKLRVGDYRIILQRLPNGIFIIDRAGNRKIVYDN